MQQHLVGNGLSSLKVGLVSFTLVATALSGFPAKAQPAKATAAVNPNANGQVTLGAARFTIISPLCIRLEYAPSNGFVDAPTLFATNRSARDTQAKVARSEKRLVIDTGQLHLVYVPDGKPFNSTNLQVTFQNGKQPGNWHPGQENGGNLGGPVATLDGVSRPLDLPPGLISRDGWGLIDDSGRPILIDNWIAPRPGGGPPSVEGVDTKNQDLDWYLFAYGHNYQAALRSLGLVSGRAAMPRKEVLGSWNSRWARLSSNDFRQIVQEYQQHDFPLDIQVMDMDWHTTTDATSGYGHAGTLGWTGYTWNKQLIPDPQELLQEFKNEGIFVTLNDHPHDGIRDHEEVYPDFMKSLGLTPARGNNLPFDAGDKRYMDAFFAASHNPLEKEGVDFWWVDWQQDGVMPWVPGVPGLRHLPWLNELYFRQSERGGLRGQDYSRWGGWGDQRHPLQFSGDTSSNWNVLAFEVPFTTASGNAGCFFWAHDTGGFGGGSHNAEMYTRWTQFSGLSAALRVHSAGEDRRPWLWGQQFEDAMRTTYHLRSELFPYIYTSVRQCYDGTLPLLRPMYLMYPDQEQAYHAPGQYLLGDNVLVAPIVSPGVGPNFVAKQNLWFPAGSWYNALTGEKFEGNQQTLVTADIGEVPLYVRAGVPIPMQPYTQRMGSTPITTLRVRCYPGEEGKTGTANLYEDDGRSDDYQTTGAAKTPLSYVRHGNSVTVTIGATQGSYRGQAKTRSAIIELAGTLKASTVTLLDGAAPQSLTVQYDETAQLNRIVVPSRAIGQSTTIKIVCASANPDVMRQRALLRRMQGILGKTPASTDALKVLASSPDATPEQQAMLLATLGIGMVQQTDGPSFRSNPTQTLFYAPQGLLDGNKVSISTRTGQSSEKSLKSAPVRLTDTVTARTSPTLRFRIKGQPFQIATNTGPLFSADNVALDARVTVSSVEGGYSAQGAIDGIADGYPNNTAAEWSSSGQKEGATLQLDWTQPQTVDRIVLFDRPNSTDDVTSGQLTFSDGSTLEVGALSNQGTEIRFAPKTITSLTFKVTGVKAGTQNAGLSEIAVFKAAH